MRRAFRHDAPALQLAAEEDLLLDVTHEDRSNRIRQSPLRHVAARDACRLLDVARGAGRHLLVAEHDLFRNAPAVRHHQPRLELLPRHTDAIRLGQRIGDAQRAATRHDGHLVQRIVALHHQRTDGVPALVIGRAAPLLFTHHERLALGAHHHAVLRLLEIEHVDLVVIPPRGQQRALVDEVREVCAGHAGCASRERHDVDVWRDGLVAHVHTQDAFASTQVGKVHNDLAVEPAGPQQRRVEHVGTVGGGNEDDALVRFKSVHLNEELVERLLSLVVSAAKARTAMTTHRVDLVDEDDARRVRLALLEQVADATRAHAHEHFDKVGTRHRKERPASLARHGAREQRLARPRRTDQQRPLRQPAAELGELLRVLEKLNDFLQLHLRLVGAGHVGERDLGRIAREQLRL